MSISKVELFARFRDLVLKFQSFGLPLSIDITDWEHFQYGQAKRLSKNYQENWELLKSDGFGVWTEKDPQLLQFTLEN